MGTAKAFDPELVYVECAVCGMPVLWEDGKSTEVIEWSGIRPGDLDASCMIISDGCPACQPEQAIFDTQVVRVHTLAEPGIEAPPPV